MAPAAFRLRQRLLAGLVGALTVTVLNESVRRMMPHAPRIDVIGERGLTKVLRAVGITPPQGRTLYWSTLAADLISNSLFYSLVGVGRPEGAGNRGLLLGLGAGVGAAGLPPRIGLGHPPGERWPLTPLLTACWYLAGGLATAVPLNVLHRRNGS
jgi:hypothetical protein